MTELESNVYDLIYQSPMNLKDISCSVIAVSFWRWNLNQYRVNDNLSAFKPGSNILLKDVIPDTLQIPSMLSCIVEKYINRFGSSLDAWLLEHFDRVIFEEFDDFVYDRDGTINYVNTAKRMISCDRLSDDVKFEIACMYCLENDVRKFWPSVSEGIDLNEVDFNVDPHFFYWICFCLLRNELNKVPNYRNIPVDEMMLYMCPSHNWSSLEYFWNRLRYENRMRIAIELSTSKSETFIRFFLTKMDELELEMFVVERGSQLMYSVLIDDSVNEFYAFPTWTFIRNKMNGITFTNLVENLLRNEANNLDGDKASDSLPTNSEDWSRTDYQIYFYCEVWRNADDKLKQTALKLILLHEGVFIKQNNNLMHSREVRFLLTVLSDATSKERNAFWLRNWRNLMCGTHSKNLQRIMNLCFENENRYYSIKQTSLAINTKI